MIRIKDKKHNPDKTLLVIIFIILGFGLVVLASASSVISQERFGTPYHYFFHQLIYGLGIGLVLFFLTQKIYYRFWRKYAFILLIICLFSLVLVFIPKIGIRYGGAKRWINLGFMSFQPSELLKLGFIIYLAAWFEGKKTEIKKFSYGLIPFLILIGIIGILIIAQPDFGTLITITVLGTIIFFLAGARLGHILLVVLLGLALIFILIKIAPYRMNRILAFLNPEIDPLGIGYQIRQSLLAIGSGGFWGVGLGYSRQKYNYLPSPASDSIFAIVAEELGFIGGVALIFVFLFLGVRGFKIVNHSPDRFAKLASAGITSWFVIQAFINIGAIISLIPLTGITLPFVSYGASSMVISLVGAGILVNISKYTKNG